MESRLGASNGLSLPSVGDQRPHHSVAKQGHFAGQVSRDAPAVVVTRSTKCAKIQAATGGKDQSCSATRSTGGAYKTSHMLLDRMQTWRQFLAREACVCEALRTGKK